MIRLASGEWEAALQPELGGSIAMLRHRGTDILRPTPPGASDPLETACFPLVPYANRIAHGRFAWEGEAIALPRNFDDHPHPLHGVGWQRPWRVTAQDGRSATLRLDHAADANWAWSFAAEQYVALDDQGLCLELSLCSRDTRPMPAGLGFHPYFPRSPDSRFRARLSAAWLADDTMLPIEPAPADRFGDWTKGDRVERTELVDHIHAGWDGVARIEAGGRSTVIAADGASFLHLYMPPGEAFFCAEPVSHMPDAINRDGMAILAPGETLAIAMRICRG